MSVSFHSGYLPGCIGRIVELHAAYYSRLVHFGLVFETKVARELAEFCERYDATRDGLWLMHDNGRVDAAIAIDGVDAAERGAHLRWFIAAQSVRGTGIGDRLLRSAVEFCDARRYPLIYLWTFEGLDAARHLYEKHGFALRLQQPGAQWGVQVNEQLFERRRN